MRLITTVPIAHLAGGCRALVISLVIVMTVPELHAWDCHLGQGNAGSAMRGAFAAVAG
jgi:hypothetical protein